MGNFLAMSKDDVQKNLLISMFVNSNNIERKMILQELTIRTGEFVNLLNRNRYFQETFTHMLSSIPQGISFTDKQQYFINNGPSFEYAVEILSNPTALYSFLMNKPKNTKKVVLRFLCNRATPEESRNAATKLISCFLKMENKHLIINDSNKSEEIKSLVSFALPDEFIEWIANSMDDPLIDLDYDPEGTFRYRFFFTYTFTRACAVNSSYCDVFLKKFLSNPALQDDKNLNFGDKIVYLNQNQLETLFNHYKDDILNANLDYEHHIYRIFKQKCEPAIEFYTKNFKAIFEKDPNFAAQIFKNIQFSSPLHDLCNNINKYESWENLVESKFAHQIVKRPELGNFKKLVDFISKQDLDSKLSDKENWVESGNSISKVYFSILHNLLQNCSEKQLVKIFKNQKFPKTFNSQNVDLVPKILAANVNLFYPYRKHLWTVEAEFLEKRKEIMNREFKIL